MTQLRQQAKGMGLSLGDPGHGAGMSVPSCGQLEAMALARNNSSSILSSRAANGSGGAAPVNMALLSMPRKESVFKGRAHPQHSIGDWAQLKMKLMGGRCAWE